MQKGKKDKFESADEPGITKLEFRRRMLKQRVREWDAFLLTRPDVVSLDDFHNDFSIFLACRPDILDSFVEEFNVVFIYLFISDLGG